jgi:hypothetical protein
VYSRLSIRQLFSGAASDRLPRFVMVIDPMLSMFGMDTAPSELVSRGPEQPVFYAHERRIGGVWRARGPGKAPDAVDTTVSQPVRLLSAIIGSTCIRSAAARIDSFNG